MRSIRCKKKKSMMIANLFFSRGACERGSCFFSGVKKRDILKKKKKKVGSRVRNFFLELFIPTARGGEEEWCSSKSMYTKSIYDFVPHLDLD